MTAVQPNVSSSAPVAVRCPAGRDQVRWLLDRHRHHPEVVTLNPPACLRLELHEIAEAALENLGHDRDLMAGTRSAETLAIAWMQAGGITDALLVDAQIHPADRVRAAVEWLLTVGARPWLCITRPDPYDRAAIAVEDLAAEYGGATVAYTKLADRFADVTQPAGTQVDLPGVPYVDGVVFRPVCKALLAPEDFARVDTRFVATVRQVRAALRADTDRQRGRGARHIIRGILEDARSLEELIIDARAVQVGALALGVHVRVSMPALIGGDATIPRRGQLARTSAWEKLARYRDPDVGAVAALYFGGFDPETIPALTIADAQIRADGRVTITGPDGTVIVDEPQAKFLRALIIYRRLTAENDQARLLHTHRAETVRTHHISALLTRPATEVGVALAPTPIRATQLSSELWLTRHGITVEVVTRKDAKHLKSAKEETHE